MSLIRILRHQFQIRFGSRRIYYKNVEGKREFYIRSHRQRKNKRGISAIMRVQNEEAYLEAAVLSALRLADEVVCVDNFSSDKTLTIAKTLAAKDHRIRVYEYPFMCFESGPEHSGQPPNSIRSRSYFYNWCMSLANFSHLWKWDGDQVLSDSIGLKERELILNSDITHGFGVDLFSISPMIATKEPFTSNEPHFFRNSPGFHYFMGDPCEFFSYPNIFRGRRCKIGNLNSAYFYHLKYVNRGGIGKGWMPNWHENEYFHHLVNERKSQGESFKEAIPKEFDLIKIQ